MGLLSDDNARVMVLLSALSFSAAFLIYLNLLHSYLRRSLTLCSVLATGVVWFGLLDYFNALWDFQFAWYFIILMFVASLWLLLRDGLGTAAFLGAMATAVLGSYSSVQGLLIWVVGLLCLAWPLWHDRRQWNRIRSIQVGTWVIAAGITTALYYWNFAPSETGQFVPVTVRPPLWSLHHPLHLAQFFIVDIGNLVPRGGVALRETLGVAILAAAVGVVIDCIRRQRSSRLLPLPIALIAFGLAYDWLVSVGRLSLGLDYAVKSQYTMPNVVLLVGVVTYLVGGSITRTHGPGRAPSPRRSSPLACALALEYPPSTGSVAAERTALRSTRGSS